MVEVFYILFDSDSSDNTSTMRVTRHSLRLAQKAEERKTLSKALKRLKRKRQATKAVFLRTESREVYICATGEVRKMKKQDDSSSR